MKIHYLFTFAFRFCLVHVHLGLRLNEIYFPRDKIPPLISPSSCFQQCHLNLRETGKKIFVRFPDRTCCEPPPWQLWQRSLRSLKERYEPSLGLYTRRSLTLPEVWLGDLRLFKFQHHGWISKPGCSYPATLSPICAVVFKVQYVLRVQLNNQNVADPLSWALILDINIHQLYSIDTNR